MYSKIKYILIINFASLFGCKKMVEIPKSTGFVTYDEVFSNDDEAMSAASGMYTLLTSSGQLDLANAGATIFCGMSADELNSFSLTTQDYYQLQFNSLNSNNGVISKNVWSKAYSVIYSANAIIEGLQSFQGVHDSIKNELIGQAEFIRAFCNFYIINLFGNAPLITTVNYHKTALLPRTDTTQIYDQIINDLRDAQNRLQATLPVDNGPRIIPNKWAATALLARVYLYRKDWQNAEQQASTIINSGLFYLETDLHNVFLLQSTESIWQLQQSNIQVPYNATMEGYSFIPYQSRSSSHPTFYLTPTLLASFEKNDARKTEWLDSTTYGSKVYYYPYKYKTGKSEAVVGGSYTELNMVFRLAEQYLIRAEARAQQGNDLASSATDINTIRGRANLSTTTATTQTELLAAVQQERRVEFFAEWGHRWFDLKRWAVATQILSVNKGIAVDNNDLLYPIPQSEITVDPNLTQNPGY